MPMPPLFRQAAWRISTTLSTDEVDDDIEVDDSDYEEEEEEVLLSYTPGVLHVNLQPFARLLGVPPISNFKYPEDPMGISEFIQQIQTNYHNPNSIKKSK